jgi:hypothetical protein
MIAPLLTAPEGLLAVGGLFYLYFLLSDHARGLLKFFKRRV